ncbi:MAG: hypothetical protein BGO12_13195 [Verrucomicrobia bacterium 61-8]|nr:protein BatD [Verrucomicrobiota bacterium]OJV02482.1 MAG: hypothetical protein BGO12_13195 [Verrucomicrobia bacterium 61-8]
MHTLTKKRMRSGAIALGAAFLMAASGYAQKVSADLSQEVTAVGQAVQLNISVTGATGARVPAQVKVDGLRIDFAGRSEQINIINFQKTVSSIYTYLITPMRTGDFNIPPIEVLINGQRYKTAQLTLRVGNNSGGVPVMPGVPVQPGQSARARSLQAQMQAQMQALTQFMNQQGMPAPQTQQSQPSQGQSPPPDDEAEVAYGDLIIPKTSAYVGEVIPVEIRFYFNANYPTQLINQPDFGGDGFTVMDFSKPTQREQEINGVPYNVVIFQTAITAVKSGPLEIPPAKIMGRIQVPARGSSQDDFFSGFFGGQGFGTTAREMTVSTKPSRIDIKPLPKENRPEDFSGAIGQFSLDAKATPKKVDAGEPVTLSVKVAGRGNFNAITAPTLVDAENWRSYPPNEKFTPSASDPIGYNGEKVFEYTIVARSDATLTPSPEFSFFDPAVEKYVTLKAPPIAVVAKGSAAAAPTTATAQVSATPTPQAAAPTPAATVPTAKTSDLVTSFRRENFQPTLTNPAFLGVNGLVALALLALLSLGILRAAASSEASQRAARLREVRRILHSAEDPNKSAEEFFALAADFVNGRLAVAGGMGSTRDMLESSRVSSEIRTAIYSLLDQADEARYAAGHGVSLDREIRHTYIQQLKKFDAQA